MPERPNVVFVICDQMRRQAMSCAGDPNVETPNLDRLAENGVRFTSANSTTPICVPARFSIVTGEHAHTRHAHHHWRMSPAEQTFAHRLSDEGYATSHIGKWHLADVGRDRPVPEKLQGGFEYWRGFEVKNNPFDTYYYEGDDPTPHELEGYQTDGLFDLGSKYLEEETSPEQPFFLTLSVEPPHPPFDAPDEYLERWEDLTLDLRPNVPLGEELPANFSPSRQYSQWGDVEHASEELYESFEYHGETLLDEMRKYYAMIENLDDNVGELVAELEDRGIRDETAIIFTSDHGELLGSHGLMMKQHPHEESVGIPLIVSYPDGGIDTGEEIDIPTCLEDLYPTILGLADIDAEDDKPGVDLTEVMADEQSTIDRDGVLLEFPREIRPGLPYHEGTWRAFRTERYKYTVNGYDSLGGGQITEGGEPWALYDLEADPYEQHNLIDDPEHEDVATEMHGKLRDALIRYEDDYALEPAFGYDSVNLSDNIRTDTML